jgi:branched-subunit amino acid ABC-type transport system permease component
MPVIWFAHGFFWKLGAVLAIAVFALVMQEVGRRRGW